jgi:hypothetical protein
MYDSILNTEYNFTPHTVISIENLLFGSNNLTNEKQFDRL